MPSVWNDSASENEILSTACYINIKEKFTACLESENYSDLA